MRYLILSICGFGDYDGVELAAVQLDTETLAWLHSLLTRTWPAGIRSVRLVEFPGAIEFLDPPADTDAAFAFADRLADEDWLVIDDAERQTLRPAEHRVDLADVEVLIDGAGAATAVNLIAGIDFRGGYVEGFTRRELTLDLLREADSAGADGTGAASC